MDLRIKSNDYKMTPEISDYLNNKLASIEKILADEADTTRCEVGLGRAVGHSQQGEVWEAEIIVQNGGGRHVATARGESIQAAIDVAKDEMLQQLRKSKGRGMSLMRRMGSRLKKFARRGDMRSY